MDLEILRDKLIVSCQALPDEPLHSSFIMSRMARAVAAAGATAIRANSMIDILAIKEEISLPIIGIIKREYEGSDVYITPTVREIDQLAICNVEIIAMDATTRKRPKQSLSEIVRYTRMRYPDVLLMADTSTVEEAQNAEKLGFDLIGTTMHGYTDYTRGLNIADNNFSYLHEIVHAVHTPVVAEGKLSTPEMAKHALDVGAYTVVVGSAITRPQLITAHFVDKINNITK
ncbi:N-acetylmannosamine-6-phosphate 2-epimerase [Lapidilactobacillus achengensis]|uniref:Putative N-acetylmannosamine-6-phosphate 2-epimerase n=1 Tax=Lapidilactobacillus achengensis TaxID=2486000 RepID=A0ABW1UPU7_9LACO|nr:N-acetylmannosamine-6-phosphate 2-epimerase [Lapidilactobacillus achengensis]